MQQQHQRKRAQAWQLCADASGWPAPLCAVQQQARFALTEQTQASAVWLSVTLSGAVGAARRAARRCSCRTRGA